MRCKKKTFTLTLNEYGKAKLKLPKAKKVGNIKVKVEYLGDAAVLGAPRRSSRSGSSRT